MTTGSPPDGGAPSATWESPRSLLPAAGLVLAASVAIGTPLLLNDFAYSPIREAFVNAWRALPFLGAVVAARVLLRLGRHRGMGRIDRVTLRRSAFSTAACWMLLAAVVSPFCWGKVLVPFFNPRLWDEELYRFDLAIHLDTDPVLFLHALLDSPALDWTIGHAYELYPHVVLVTSAWFMTLGNMEQRHRFVAGVTILWLAGLGLYLAMPALGPCYVSESLLPVLRERFPANHELQVTLLRNYQAVKGVLAGTSSEPIDLAYGIAAMPSLHVAFPAYVTFHCRHWRHPARHFFLVVTLFFLVGSVVTGWHYAVDGYAGILLAGLCWLPVRRWRGGPEEPVSERTEAPSSAPEGRT